MHALQYRCTVYNAVIVGWNEETKGKDNTGRILGISVLENDPGYSWPCRTSERLMR